MTHKDAFPHRVTLKWSAIDAGRTYARTLNEAGNAVVVIDEGNYAHFDFADHGQQVLFAIEFSEHNISNSAPAKN